MSGDVPARHSVRVDPAGWAFEAPASVPLLTSARRAGIVLPSSCRNGTCRTCLCRLVEGEIRYSIDWPGVSVDEKREGLILPCVATPLSDLVINAPFALDLRLSADPP